MIPGMYPDTAVRLRAPELDTISGGFDWAHAERLTLTGVRLEPLTSQEQTDLGTTALTHRLRGAITLDLRSTDRIEIDDGFGLLLLDVDGSPLRYRGGLGALDHSVTMLRGQNSGR